LHSHGKFPSDSRKLPLRNFQARRTLLPACSRKIRGLTTRLPDRHSHPAARNGPDRMALSPVSRLHGMFSLIRIRRIAASAASRTQGAIRVSDTDACGVRLPEFSSRANFSPELHATGERRRQEPAILRRRHHGPLPRLHLTRDPPGRRTASHQRRMQHIHKSECAKRDHQQRQHEPAAHSDHHDHARRPHALCSRASATAAGAMTVRAKEVVDPQPRPVPCPGHERH
jgi:hypothetical protein